MPNHSDQDKLREWVEEKAERFAFKCPGFPLGDTRSLYLLKDFILSIKNELKPVVDKRAWDEFSKEMDGEMLSDYYVGANRVFEWLREIVGVEVKDTK